MCVVLPFWTESSEVCDYFWYFRANVANKCHSLSISHRPCCFVTPAASVIGRLETVQYSKTWIRSSLLFQTQHSLLQKTQQSWHWSILFCFPLSVRLCPKLWELDWNIVIQDWTFHRSKIEMLSQIFTPLHRTSRIDWRARQVVVPIIEPSSIALQQDRLQQGQTTAGSYKRARGK